MKIKKEDILSEIFSNYPIVMKEYIKNGFHCVGCDINCFDTVEESLQNHNIENIPAFIDYLNEIKNIAGKSPKIKELKKKAIVPSMAYIEVFLQIV